jgi:large subunit ribosomal protein L17
MRHLRNTVKLGRSPAHREALLASLVCNLIIARRIRTTIVKSKLARSLAEKMVTLAKEGSLHSRRQAIATLRRKECVAQLFTEVAPVFKDRKGGYTRITRIGQRGGDGAEMAYLEWINFVPAVKKAAPEAEAKDTKEAAKETKKEPKKVSKKEAATA